jgi:DNA-binding transcriptional regulator YiaG
LHHCDGDKEQEIVMLHYEDSGLPNVWLASGFERIDTPYGEAVVIHDVPGLTRAICTALIRKQARLTGPEFRYIRQAMLLSQASLGNSLGRTDQAVAGWEKTGKIPKYADIMLRVLYAAHADGNEKVRNIVHALNEVDRVINIVMTDSPEGWFATETTSSPVLA